MVQRVTRNAQDWGKKRTAVDSCALWNCVKEWLDALYPKISGDGRVLIEGVLARCMIVRPRSWIAAISCCRGNIETNLYSSSEF